MRIFIKAKVGDVLIVDDIDDTGIPGETVKITRIILNSVSNSFGDQTIGVHSSRLTGYISSNNDYIQGIVYGKR